MILVKHVGRTSLHLRLEDAEPELLSLHGLAAFSLRLQAEVHLVELLTPDVHETDILLLIIGLVGAEQRPVLVVLDSAHEEVWDPKPIEQVPGALLLLAVILPHLQEVEDICMPRLQVHGKGTLALASTLIHVPRRLVEVPEHRDQPVAVTVGPSDVGALGTHVRDSNSDATCTLRDQCAFFQGVVDAVDAILLHGQQEAGRHLRLRCAGIEQRGGGMCEHASGHQVIRLHGCSCISAVDTASHSHDHVLRPLDDPVVHAEEVGLLQRLEAEEVVVEVSLVDHCGI
mmetsp:Transcript_91538/g.165287  ORF Transcript_91538/g.165287 Transcript_91538/m.165287 type:complete len:286 (-) Transcript_91538:495-1352(-)